MPIHRKANVSIRWFVVVSYLGGRLAHLCEDANKILVATRSCFVHTSIDYTHQINVLFDQHKVDLIELFFSYLNSHKAFFHQGYELLAIDTERDWNSINNQVSSEGERVDGERKLLFDRSKVTRMRQENVRKQKDLDRFHENNQRRVGDWMCRERCLIVVLVSSGRARHCHRYHGN